MIFLASGIVTFSEAVYLVIAGPRRRDTMTASGMLAGYALLACGIYLYLSWDFRLFLIGRTVVAVAAPLLPLLWMLFASVWGRDPREDRIPPRRIWGLSSVFVLVCILAFGGIVQRQFGYTPGTLAEACFVFGRNGYVVVLLAMAGALFGLYDIENCYRAALGSQKRKLRGGLRILLALVAYAMFVGTVEALLDCIPIWITIVGAVGMPVLGLQLVKHLRTSDPTELGVVVTRRSGYSSTVIMVGGGYFCMLGLVTHMVQSFGESRVILISVTSGLMTLLLFLAIPAFRRSRDRSSRSDLIGGEEGTYNRVSELIEDLAGLKKVGKILERISLFMRTGYGIGAVAFVEVSDDQRCDVRRSDGEVVSIDYDKVKPIMDWLHLYGRPIEQIDLKERVQGKEIDLSALEEALGFDPEMLVPLASRQDMIGLLAIREHDGNEPVADELTRVMETLSIPLAMAIHNSRVTGELLKARELESFHKVSSFVLHDLKNSVSMLDMLMTNARKNMDDPEFRESIFGTVNDAVMRQRRIIARLSGAAEGELALESVSVNDLLSHVLDKTQVRNIERIELTTDLGELPRLNTDRQKLASVFENLLVNAVEAMPTSGRLELTTESKKQPDGVAAVVVRIRDTGAGMNQEFIARKLFRPFTSTKKKGLGIGMYQSKEIVCQMGGEISVESEPGNGTCFEVTIPV